MLDATIRVNERQRLVALEKLQQELKILKGKTIGLLGLTFKPDTDDLRDAPALTLVEQLQRLGAKVKAYDPIIPVGSDAVDASILTGSPEELAVGCDALVLVTEWDVFREIDFAAIAPGMRQTLLIDGRNFLDPQALRQAGFRYIGIGR